MDGLSIAAGTVADVPLLQPLWLGIHRAHQDAMPELGPYVSDDTSWQVRRALYQDLLARRTSFLLLAREGDEIAGYAVGYVRDDTDEDWLSDTWALRGPVGELESLSVRPSSRGKGIGSALLEAVDAQFTALNVSNQVVGMLPGNSDALRLYQRHGYRPTWLYLSRFTT